MPSRRVDRDVELTASGELLRGQYPLSSNLLKLSPIIRGILDRIGVTLRRLSGGNLSPQLQLYASARTSSSRMWMHCLHLGKTDHSYTRGKTWGRTSQRDGYHRPESDR